MKRFIFIAIASLFMVTNVTAQGLGLGPQLGYQKAADAEEGKLMGGAALRLKLTSALGVEGSINYRQEKYAEGNIKVKSWPILVTGLIYPLPIVYGAIGFGWYNTTFEFESNKPLYGGATSETEQQVGWHFGAGVELPVGTNVKFTGDIRYVFLNYDFDTIPGSDEVDSDFYMITVGLLFGL